MRVRSLRLRLMLIILIPLAVLFLLLQRYYVKGLAMSGIKG